MDATPARLFDPQSGKTVRCQASWTSSGLEIEVEGLTTTVDPSGISLERGGWEDTGLHVTWKDDRGTWALMLDAGPGLEAFAAGLPAELRARMTELTRGVRKAERRGVRTMTVLGVLASIPVLLLVLLFVFRGPIIDAVVRRLPVAVDAQLGALSFESVKAGGTLVDSGPEVDAVKAMGARLTEKLESPFTFQFSVVRDPSVNAFAAPGGFVVVHTGLLAAAKTPDEVAGVLGHEIAHVLRRHSLRQLVYQAGLGTSVSLLFGSPDGAAGALAGAATELTKLGFSREQESEADRVGLDVLRDARLPADGLVAFFGTLTKEGPSVPALLSTHPPSEARAGELKAELARRGTWPTEALAIDWAAVQAAAKATKKK